ncbi:hypothetical protein [Roseomonas rosulenta]|uniref:hypothetical protein n=1 Tax=Roseomonas rosulenta TaxID=2748667 RepID=UPI0018DEFFF1|nr:hypothetical protein [Roseomonas rosulenta]
MRPLHVLVAAMLAMFVYATIARDDTSGPALPVRWPSCWLAAPMELAPFACGEHGALTASAGD